LFVHVGADLDFVDGAEDERRGGGGGGGVFAGADVDLENGSGDGGADDQSFDERLGLGGGGTGGFELGGGDGDIAAPEFDFLSANGAGVTYGFEASELIAEALESGVGDGDLGALGGEGGAEVAVVEGEERLAGFDAVPDFGVDGGDEAGRGHADEGVFTASFDDTGGTDGSGKWFGGGRDGWRGDGFSEAGAQSEDEAAAGDEAEKGEPEGGFAEQEHGLSVIRVKGKVVAVQR